MKVKVDVNIAQVVSSRITDKSRLFLANTMYKLMNDYVPMDSGTLSQTVDITPEYIYYKVPYAERAHDGDELNFSKEKHPLATAHWEDAMFDARGEKLVQTMQRYYDKGGI